MSRSRKVWTIAAIIVILVAISGYVYAQFSFAHKPSLANIPEYPSAEYRLKGSSYPFDDLAPQEKASAEEALTQFVSSVEAGYHIVGQRFLATKGGFTWDAIRSKVGSYLSDTGFRVQTAGQTPDSGIDIAYLVWQRHNRLQRLFNNNIIVAAALQNPIRPAPLDEQIHVYSYFELAPN